MEAAAEEVMRWSWGHCDRWFKGRGTGGWKVSVLVAQLVPRHADN